MVLYHHISSKARANRRFLLFGAVLSPHRTAEISHNPPYTHTSCCPSHAPSRSQTKRPFLALVSGLQDVLDACPAMPALALETSIQDCLRRPSPGAAAWSLGAARVFVGGVLSLVSRSPRSLSLCQAVVSVLVRFVAEKGCGLAGESSGWCWCGLACLCLVWCRFACRHHSKRLTVR